METWISFLESIGSSVHKYIGSFRWFIRSRLSSAYRRVLGVMTTRVVARELSLRFLTFISCVVLTLSAGHEAKLQFGSGSLYYLQLSASSGPPPGSITLTRDGSHGHYSLGVRSMMNINISCAVLPLGSTINVGSSIENPPRFLLSWTLPSSVHRDGERRVTKFKFLPSPNGDVLVLSLDNTTKEDSGIYRCEARGSDDGEEVSSSQTVRLFVARHPSQCKENWFRCHGKKSCIHPRYVCDGQEDCDDPSDESDEICGDACEGKLYCQQEGRCLAPEICCPRLPAVNCTPDICCNSRPTRYSVSLDSDPITRTFRPAGKDLLGSSGAEYLQTSVFVVMGCALAFVFITIALITSVYRFRLMREVMMRTARHYSTNAARVMGPRSRLDVVSWLPHGGGGAGAANYLVTYNINHGVQILAGGDVNHLQMPPPPSYNEAVRTGATGSDSRALNTVSVAPLLRDSVGPPPPYASRESLVTVGLVQSNVETAASPLLSRVNEVQQVPPDDEDNNGNNVEFVEENNNHVMNRNHLSQ